MELQKSEEKIIEKFKLFEGWEERYEYLIELGKQLPKISEKDRSKFKLIQGCQSQVWLNAYLKKNQVILQADSDAILPKGIAALIIQVYSGMSPKEIIKSKATFISKIGFKEFLSSIRSNGMLSMIKQVKFYAMAFEIKKT